MTFCGLVSALKPTYVSSPAMLIAGEVPIVIGDDRAEALHGLPSWHVGM